MASPASADSSLRSRLDTLLREVGVATSKGTMLEDAQTVAAAVGIGFSSIRTVVEQAEEVLLGSAVAAALVQVPGGGRPQQPLPPQGAAEADTEPFPKRRRSGAGGGPQDAAPAPAPAPAPASARSAFSLFCAERRAEVARRLGVPPGSDGCQEVDLALAEAYRGLEPSAKEAYDACAAVERQRFALEQLRRGVRSEAHAPKIAKRVREAIAIMANAPKTARASGLFEGIVAALEDLDRRMAPRVRAKLGEHLGPSIVSKEAQAIARRVFGQLNGTRLVLLLRRWCDPQLQVGIAAEPVSRPVRLNKPGAIVKAHAAGPTSDETRTKVMEFLARILSKSSATAAVELSREIERELFALAGADPKEYRSRARALTFNLGANDGVLRDRVAGGDLAPAELVRLAAEELASDALKAERDEERRKYFQSEVLVTERVPKRRRELLSGPPRGRAAERLEAGEPEDSAGDTQEAPLAAGLEGDAAEEAAANAPAALLDAEPGRGAQAALAEGPEQTAEAQSEAEAEEAQAEADVEEAALLLLEDTSNDDAIAKLLQMMPPTPSSSSGSSSDSDSELPAAVAVQLARSQSASQVEGASPGASSSQAVASSSSSSSSSPAPGALVGLEHVLAMGFERGAAEAALSQAHGSVEAAVNLLCGVGAS